MALNALKVEKAVCPLGKAKVMLSDGDGLHKAARRAAPRGVGRKE